MSKADGKNEHEKVLDGRRYLDVEGMAARYDYSEHHIRSYVRLGKIPGARKLGRRWWIDVEIFEREYKEGTRASAPSAFQSKKEVAETHAQQDHDILGDLA